MASTYKPVIGITLDAETSGEYSDYPFYALRENYTNAVTNHGGIPLLLPHEPECVDTYLAMIDGLIVTGGAFDVDPSLYGESDKHETVTTKDRRTAFEKAILEQAIEQEKPTLAICGGEQLLNVILGGTLIQHIPDQVENALNHEQTNPKHEPSHSIAIKPGTLLHQITNQKSMEVNSTHHQAVQDIAKKLTITATAPDGIIEAIEHPEHPFCIGVQWHPEFEIDKGDSAIFKAFIAASSHSTLQAISG